jgi:hypothetical protein
VDVFEKSSGRAPISPLVKPEYETDALSGARAFNFSMAQVFWRPT